MVNHDRRPVFTKRPDNFDELVEMECENLRTRGYIQFQDERGAIQKIYAHQPDESAAVDDGIKSLGALEHCDACGRRKARPSDGFCGGCGARPDAVARYESYQVMARSNS